MSDAHMLYETGWPPGELDAMPEERLQLYLLYKAVRLVRDYGGELRF